MSAEGHVLVVDDEQDTLDTFREMIAEEGFASEMAKTRAEAIEAFKRPGLAVVLLDQRLRGPDDSNSGLDLLSVAKRTAPHVKVIVVTGYPDRDAIRRAFAEGAWDYLRKDSFLDVFLRVKVRNAMEVWRERSLAALTSEKREQEITRTWSDAQTEADPHKKGKLLETLMLLIFRSIAGFEHAQVNQKNRLEEVDVVVQNASTDPFWQKEGSYVLVECKNWSSSVGVGGLKLFRNKIEDRYGRSALGFFIAVGGYTDTTKIEEWTRRSGNSLVVLLDRNDLSVLVASRDRNATLKQFHARAVTARAD